jgi:hypothetical protein
LADSIKTYQYNRFFANKKSGLSLPGTAFSRIVPCPEPLFQELLRLVARRGKIESMHLATRKKTRSAAAIPQ